MESLIPSSFQTVKRREGEPNQVDDETRSSPFVSNNTSNALLCIQDTGKNMRDDDDLKSDESTPNEPLCNDKYHKIQTGSDRALCFNDATAISKDLKEALQGINYFQRQLNKYINEERARTFALLRKDIEEYKFERSELLDNMMPVFESAKKEMETLFDRMRSKMTCHDPGTSVESGFEFSHFYNLSAGVLKVLDDLRGEIRDGTRERRQLTNNIHNEEIRTDAITEKESSIKADDTEKLVEDPEGPSVDTRMRREELLSERIQPTQETNVIATNMQRGIEVDHSRFPVSEAIQVLRGIQKELKHLKQVRCLLRDFINEERIEVFSLLREDENRIKSENKNLREGLMNLFEEKQRDIMNCVNKAVIGSMGSHL